MRERAIIHLTSAITDDVYTIGLVGDTLKDVTERESLLTELAQVHKFHTYVYG